MDPLEGDEMKNIFTFFLFIFLSACTVYTVTNKTNENLKVVKAGGQEVTVEASMCIELSEYFLGLGGDFPFAINKKEYSAGHYEITPASVATVADASTTTHSAAGGDVSVEVKQEYSVSLSAKNTACEPSKLQANNNNEVLSVVCGDQPAQCAAGNTAECITEGDQTVPVCVNTAGQRLTDMSPTCKDSSKKPECKSSAESSVIKVNNTRRAFCLSGTVQCVSTGGVKIAGVEVKCVGDDQNAIPVCLNQNNEKVAGNILCRTSAANNNNNKGPKCLPPVVVRIAPEGGPALSCNVGSGGTTRGVAVCSEGYPVCGMVTGDWSFQPYCVNEGRTLWPVSVTCSSGADPACGPLI